MLSHHGGECMPQLVCVFIQPFYMQNVRATSCRGTISCEELEKGNRFENGFENNLTQGSSTNKGSNCSLCSIKSVMSLHKDLPGIKELKTDGCLKSGELFRKWKIIIGEISLICNY